VLHSSAIPDQALILTGTYHSVLVTLSILIAILAAYAAINLISQLYIFRSKTYIWTQIAISGFVLGLGIWSMHFIGMMAFNLPVPVRYDGPLTLLSLIIAVVASIIGLAIAHYKHTLLPLIVGGLFLGMSVSSMHYVGMAAMRLSAEMSHDPVLVFVSILIGVIASISALWIALSIVEGKIESSFKVKLSSSTVMGFAVAGMHYTAMAATHFYVSSETVIINDGFELNPAVIGGLLTFSTILLMFFSTWSSRIASEASIVKSHEEKINAITANVIDAIITINDKGIIESVNKSVESIFGYKPDELIGKNINIIVPEPHHSSHDQYISRYIETGVSNFIGETQRELKAVRKDKKVIPIDLTVSEATINKRKIFIGVVRDVSEYVKNKEKMDYLAHHDVLTELPNRFSFMESINSSIIHAKRRNLLLAVLFIDLDRFKVINDSLGHDIGDQLLQKIAHVLTSCIREGDILARLSGDEFTIMLDDISALDDIAPIAHKIVSKLSQPFIVNGHELFTTASIGISLYPEDGDTSQLLMKNADIAMYSSKNAGGNRYRFYSSDMNERAIERLSMESELRHALERNEFVLHYQPQINIESGTVSGIEALVRWQHPEQGLVPPNEFIPLLEDTGLIVSVGEWILKEACLQNKRLQEMGIPPVVVAINMSARQFNEPNLIKTIVDILEETGLSADFLELEITESVLMEQNILNKSVLSEIDALGVQLAIDDFGTGYSSLNYLRKLPIDTLKIDQSFVSDLASNDDGAAIVELIINMANSLKLNVIAEGVETEEQLVFLREHHCGEVQGYLFSKPLTPESLISFMRKGDYRKYG